MINHSIMNIQQQGYSCYDAVIVVDTRSFVKVFLAGQMLWWFLVDDAVTTYYMPAGVAS
jgi:hypothetical protein